MHKNTINDNHVFLTSSAIINEICKPLKKIGINYVTFLKTFADGSHINLSNSAQWIEHYYQFKLYQSSLFHSKPEEHQTGYLLWPTESKLDVFLHGRNYFDSDNGITVVEQAKNHTEFFFFSGSQKNKWLQNLYLNNLDILNNFILYFKDKLKDILTESEKSRILIPNSYYQPIPEDEDFLKFCEREINDVKKHFSPSANTNSHGGTIRNAITPKNNPFIRENIALLSEREHDIVTCLLGGKTAKETAKQLFISPRTVETHLNNIKEKLKCRNKFDLVNKLLNTEAIAV